MRATAVRRSPGGARQRRGARLEAGGGGARLEACGGGRRSLGKHVGAAWRSAGSAWRRACFSLPLFFYNWLELILV